MNLKYSEYSHSIASGQQGKSAVQHCALFLCSVLAAGRRVQLSSKMQLTGLG